MQSASFNIDVSFCHMVVEREKRILAHIWTDVARNAFRPASVRNPSVHPYRCTSVAASQRRLPRIYDDKGPPLRASAGCRQADVLSELIPLV